MIYPDINHGVDRLVLDWYAGATMDYEPGAGMDNAEWEGGVAALAFGDIGLVDSDMGPTHHAQIVLHIVPHDDEHYARAISLEVDRQDIHDLVKHLEGWLHDTRDDPNIPT